MDTTVYYVWSVLQKCHFYQGHKCTIFVFIQESIITLSNYV